MLLDEVVFKLIFILICVGENNKSSDYLQRAQIKVMAEDKCLDIIPDKQNGQLICVGDNTKNGVGGCYVSISKSV